MLLCGLLSPGLVQFLVQQNCIINLMKGMILLNRSNDKTLKEPFRPVILH